MSKPDKPAPSPEEVAALNSFIESARSYLESLREQSSNDWHVTGGWLAEHPFKVKGKPLSKMIIEDRH